MQKHLQLILKTCDTFKVYTTKTQDIISLIKLFYRNTKTKPHQSVFYFILLHQMKRKQKDHW